MIKNPEESSIFAVLSLLLEVSANPKSGNVDREHDFEDLRYEHFLFSATSAFPFFLKTARNKRLYILQAVEKSRELGIETNVHFGAFLLLFPLVAVWDSKLEEYSKRTVDFLKKTSFRDSINIFKAYQLCKPRVLKAESFSLSDQTTISKIAKDKLSVYEWMKLSPKENLIAKELIEGYPISLSGANFIMSSKHEVNETIVLLYHKLLSEFPDSLIIAKRGLEVAKNVMELAKKALDSNNFDEFKKLDEFLIREKINPGTIADLVASSIYLALVGGWKIEAKGLRTLEWNK